MKKKRRVDKSRRWMRRLRAVESPDVTFVGERFPIVMSKAKGILVKDVDGNRYRDLTACFGVLALGHGSPTVKNAARRQLSRLVHGMGDVHPTRAKIQLLETLARVSPFAKAKSILGLSGSDALEAAMKTALIATGRSRFLSFSGGYHGLTFGPLALNSRLHFREGFNTWLANEATQLPFPGDDSFPLPLSCCKQDVDFDRISARHDLVTAAEVLQRLEDALRTGSYAAMVIEPLQGRGGDRIWPEGFVTEAAAIAKRYGTLIIFDEIFSGFARTGKFWGHEWLGVVPDLLCVGKALGGGFPLSACIGEDHLMNCWGVSRGEARHTSTFLGHPLACAVAHEVVTEIAHRLPLLQAEFAHIECEFERFFVSAKESGLASRMPFTLRGKGLMRGFWFFEAPEGFASHIAEDLLEHGYIALPSGPRGDVLSFTPPLTISHLEVRAFLSSLLKILKNRADLG